jgi:hypothetical protein
MVQRGTRARSFKPMVSALLNLELTRKRKRWPSTGRRNQFGSTDAKQPERERPHKAGCASVFRRWAIRIGQTVFADCNPDIP